MLGRPTRIDREPEDLLLVLFVFTRSRGDGAVLIVHVVKLTLLRSRQSRVIGAF